MTPSIYEFLDCNYGPNGDSILRDRLAQGEDCHAVADGETPLHIAARRRRLNAVMILLDHGADVNAKNRHGKTAYAHAVRRGFDEVSALLVERGAELALTDADRLAVAIVNGRIDEARALIAKHPEAVRTGNPEEDRLLADVAGRSNSDAVVLLIGAGADLAAPGLDTGAPLHQAAWFGQPENARLLINAGAPLDVFDSVHESSPLGWAVHGARYSDSADQRKGAYAELVQMLLRAGSRLSYPDDLEGNNYLSRLWNDATPEIRKLLPEIP